MSYEEKALASAAAKFAGERLPFWDESEYVRGICEVLAETFGTSDPENAKSEVWDKINAAHKREALTEHAERIAQDVLDRLCLDDVVQIVHIAQVLDAAREAALQALTEAESESE